MVWILFLISQNIKSYKLCVSFQAKLVTQVSLSQCIQATKLMVLYFLQISIWDEVNNFITPQQSSQIARLIWVARVWDSTEYQEWVCRGWSEQELRAGGHCFWFFIFLRTAVPLTVECSSCECQVATATGVYMSVNWMLKK